MKFPLLPLIALIFISLATCVFACGANSESKVSEEVKQEILETEKEVEALADTKEELEEASAKVDSLLNDLDK